MNTELTPEKRAELKLDLKIRAHNLDQLIKACEGWLSAEEGNKNMIKAIRERRKKERRQKWQKYLKFLFIY
jgi:hypothetical protein